MGLFSPDVILSDECRFVARAFPIVQSDKVRRGDDWRRSGHNSTARVSDSPAYQGTQTVLSLVQTVASLGTCLLAALDHEGAYRALPVRAPDECFVSLPTNHGPSVWQHQVLPFGSSGSVWAYLRVADVICFRAIVLAFIPAAHFVDDFFFAELQQTAMSAYDSANLGVHDERG